MTDEIKPVYCLAVAYEDGSIFIDSTAKSEVEITALAKPGVKARVIKVKVAEHRKRSLDANALYHVWIAQLTAFTGNDKFRQEAELKIHFGFPILLQDNELGKQLSWILDKYGWYELEWNQKCNLVKWIPVTRLMTTKQLRIMMENIKGWAMNDFNIELDSGKRE